MRLPSRREWTLLALAVPAILLAATAPERNAQDGDGAIEPLKAGAGKHAEVRRDADAADLDLAQLRRARPAAEPGNAFAVKSWYVPPPPPPPAAAQKALPAPAPKAPPLPFTYLGRYQDTGAPVIFLMRGDRVLSVSAGEVIEGTYRVEGIVGATLGLTYLPLNTRQTLDIGNAG